MWGRQLTLEPADMAMDEEGSSLEPLGCEGGHSLRPPGFRGTSVLL